MLRLMLYGMLHTVLNTCGSALADQVDSLHARALLGCQQYHWPRNNGVSSPFSAISVTMSAPPTSSPLTYSCRQQHGTLRQAPFSSVSDSAGCVLQV
jgi:hypothetical protein